MTSSIDDVDDDDDDDDMEMISVILRHELSKTAKVSLSMQKISSPGHFLLRLLFSFQVTYESMSDGLCSIPSTSLQTHHYPGDSVALPIGPTLLQFISPSCIDEEITIPPYRLQF